MPPSQLSTTLHASQLIVASTTLPRPRCSRMLPRVKPRSSTPSRIVAPTLPPSTHEVRVIIPRVASRTNVLPKCSRACHCTRNSGLHARVYPMSHASHVARNRRLVLSSRPTVSSIAWSCQPTHPTHASSHLTIFPKRESRHPTHPCPHVSVVRTSRPRVHESVATVARTRSHPSRPCTHVHAMIHLGHEPIPEKKS